MKQFSLRTFNSKEIFCSRCARKSKMPGGREHKAVDYFHNCCVLPITTVFFCAEWQQDCRVLFSFTIFTSPGPIRAIISQQKHCLLSSGPVYQASYSSLFIMYEAFHVKSFWPYWNSPTRRVACLFISQADVDEKCAKLWLAKDTSFSLTTFSSHLNIIAGLTQYTAFMFNYFTSSFIFNYFTAKNWEHYQNSQFFLAMFKGFLNQNPQCELQGMWCLMAHDLKPLTALMSVGTLWSLELLGSGNFCRKTTCVLLCLSWQGLMKELNDSC